MNRTERESLLLLLKTQETVMKGIDVIAKAQLATVDNIGRMVDITRDLVEAGEMAHRENIDKSNEILALLEDKFVDFTTK